MREYRSGSCSCKPEKLGSRRDCRRVSSDTAEQSEIARYLREREFPGVTPLSWPDLEGGNPDTSCGGFADILGRNAGYNSF
jgi:hypothetical protein